MTIPLNILRRLPEEIRRNQFSLRLVIGFHEDNFRVLDMGKEKIYGLALDIGSTNIECSLFDLAYRRKNRCDCLREPTDEIRK